MKLCFRLWVIGDIEDVIGSFHLWPDYLLDVYFCKEWNKSELKRLTDFFYVNSVPLRVLRNYMWLSRSRLGKHGVHWTEKYHWIVQRYNHYNTRFGSYSYDQLPYSWHVKHNCFKNIIGNVIDSPEGGGRYFVRLSNCVRPRGR